MNSNPPDLDPDECPFCFSDRKPEDHFCKVCLFPLAGTAIEKNTFQTNHADLKKSLGRAAWWINIANQSLLGAMLLCIIGLSYSRWGGAFNFNSLNSSVFKLLLFGLIGVINFVLYFFVNRFTAVTAAVAGCSGVLMLVAAFLIGRLSTTLLVVDGIYIVVMFITFYQLNRTAEQLKRHLIRGAL